MTVELIKEDDYLRYQRYIDAGYVLAACMQQEFDYYKKRRSAVQKLSYILHRALPNGDYARTEIEDALMLACGLRGNGTP